MRLPQFLNLRTSKTKQFCDTSSVFEVDNIKNEIILRDFLQKWKVECLVPMRFAIFPLHLSKVLRLPRKMYLCRSSSNVPRLPLFLEMQQNSHVLLTFNTVHNPLAPARETTSERPKVVRTCGVYHMSTWKLLPATTACTFSISQLPKVVRAWCVLHILTSKCASRHNAVHFFII